MQIQAEWRRSRGWSGLVLSVLLLAAGCSGVQVSQDYRLGTDFSGYRTYGWQRPVVFGPGDDVRASNPFLHERLQAAIAQAFGQRGMQPADNPDVVIRYSYSVLTKFEYHPGPSVGFGFGRHYRYGEVGFHTEREVRQYDVGVLVVDMSESKTGRPLWRGTGTERVPVHSTPEKTTAHVNRLVMAVLAQYPPGSQEVP